MPAIIQIPLSQLRYMKGLGGQVKPNAQVDAMAADIQEKGVRIPLIVRPVGDQYEVVCGLLRWKGAIVANLQAVPAEVRQLTDHEALELSMMDNFRPASALEFPEQIAPTPAGCKTVSRAPGAAYKIDEPLGRGLCELFIADFSLEEMRELMQESDTDSSDLESELALFWAGLTRRRLHVEGRGRDCGQFLLCYLEAYLDVKTPNVAFRGPNEALWNSLTDAERSEVAADAARLSPIVNSVLI